MAIKLPVSFKESEKDLYDYAVRKRSFSIYIKEFMQEDIEKSKKENKKTERKVQSNFNGLDF